MNNKTLQQLSQHIFRKCVQDQYNLKHTRPKHNTGLYFNCNDIKKYIKEFLDEQRSNV